MKVLCSKCKRETKAPVYNYNLRKFQPETMRRNSITSIIGKRECGTTTLIHDLASNFNIHHGVKACICACPTASGRETYSKIMDESDIYSHYTSQNFDDIRRRQDIIQNNNVTNKNLLVISDESNFSKVDGDGSFQWLFYNGVVSNTTTILALQYAPELKPEYRRQIDYVFMFKEKTNVSNKKKLYENYAGMFPTFEVFCKVLDTCTENYDCLVIDNNSNSDRVEDCVFWYRANINPVPVKFNKSTTAEDEAEEDLVVVTKMEAEATAQPYKIPSPRGLMSLVAIGASDLRLAGQSLAAEAEVQTTTRSI